jgi:Nif-specific regulatory protein
MGQYGRYVKQELVRLKEENDDLREELISLRQYIDALHALMSAITSLDAQQAGEADILSILDTLLFNALMVLNAGDGSLLALDEDTGDLVFILSHGSLGRDELYGMRVPAGKGVAGWVVENKRGTVVNNARTDDRFFAGLDTRFAFTTSSILAVPIVGHGKVLGVIEVLNKHDGQPFNDSDQALLTLLCRFAGEILYAILQQEDNPVTRAGEEPAAAS